MEIFTFLTLLLLLGSRVKISSSAPSEEWSEVDEKHSTDLMDHSTAFNETTEENEFDEAIRLARDLVEEEMLEAESSDQDEEDSTSPSAKLDEHRNSNVDVQRVAKAARAQMEVIKAYKTEWDKSKPDEATTADFWREVNKHFDGEMLKPLGKTMGHSTVESRSSHHGYCPFVTPSCQGYAFLTYRTFDGTCNNLKNSFWGSANRAQIRLLPSDYADGIEKPRIAKSGKDLPSARLVSTSLLRTGRETHPEFTAMLMQFGQLLDHDLSSTSVARRQAGLGKSRKIYCGPRRCDRRHKECFPIPIPWTDYHYKKIRCFRFIRSESSMADNCKPGPRIQPNAITAFLDASMVYGSSPDKVKELANFNTGEMKTEPNPSYHHAKPFMPLMPNWKSHCTGVNWKQRCFKGGDVRQNEQIGLTAIHTVFVRMHNHILNRIKKYETKERNPYKLFERTRRILGAIWQHMVYNEFLPLLLGQRVVQYYSLVPKTHGYFKGYSSRVRPDISLAFSTAAFRYGHSQITDFLTFTNKYFGPKKTRMLHEVQFNPSELYLNMYDGTTGVDKVLLGLISSHSGNSDHFFANEVKNHLFENEGRVGFDLTALNIQRGRDHGIPGYVKWRVDYCKLDYAIKSFYDLRDIPLEVRKELQKVYERVEDIDLFVGGMVEKHVPGAIVGPTFACIIANQFKRLKFGDRFYYENDHWHTRFTLDQLDEIRKFTMARLLCDTMDDVNTIQPNVMVKPDEPLYPGDWKKNSRVPCSHIPDINYWKFTNLH